MDFIVLEILPEVKMSPSVSTLTILVCSMRDCVHKDGLIKLKAQD